VSFLTADEVDALLAAPDASRWEGRRDRALITLAVQTGLRLSELIGLNNSNVQLDAGAHVRCTGKGRKQRCVPLTTSPSRCYGSGSTSAASARPPAGWLAGRPVWSTWTSSANWANRGLKKIGSGRVADAFIRRPGVLTATTVDPFRRGSRLVPRCRGRNAYPNAEGTYR